MELCLLGITQLNIVPRIELPILGDQSPVRKWGLEEKEKRKCVKGKLKTGQIKEDLGQVASKHKNGEAKRGFWGRKIENRKGK